MTSPAAWHEAGHAMVALLAYPRAEILWVELAQGPGRTGRTALTWPARQSQRILRDRLTVALAGGVAQRLAGVAPEEIHDDDDQFTAMMLAAQVRGGWSRAMWRARRRAERVLGVYWDSVEAVAEALDAKGILTTEDLAAAVLKPGRS